MILMICPYASAAERTGSGSTQVLSTVEPVYAFTLPLGGTFPHQTDLLIGQFVVNDFLPMAGEVCTVECVPGALVNMAKPSATMRYTVDPLKNPLAVGESDVRVHIKPADYSAARNGTYQGVLTFNVRSSVSDEPIFVGTTTIRVVKGSNTNNDHNNHSPSGGTVTIPDPQLPNAGPTFISDTTSDLNVNGTYQFKITSKNGEVPTFVVGTPGVFTSQLVKTVGNDYYFMITAIGAPGARAGIYVNGVKLLVATVATTASNVKCDTTRPFNVRTRGAYTFKLTAGTKPTFVAGAPSAFKVEFVKAVGRDYYFRVTAVGKVGANSGFYINYQKMPVAVATITR